MHVNMLWCLFLLVLLGTMHFRETETLANFQLVYINLYIYFFPSRLATLPYGLDSNVTQLLANLLTKPSVFYYLPIVSCNLVSIKLLLSLLLLLLLL